MAIAATQIHYFTISPEKDLTDANSEAGKTWAKALDLLEEHEGFRRLYWGRSPEDRSKVQLHVVREDNSQHKSFLASPRYGEFKALAYQLVVIPPSSSEFLVRHAQLRDWTENPKALGRGAPFSGTAVYVDTDAAWHEGAWPLWTHVVRHVDGCLGVTGGPVEETVDGRAGCYVVYVGWESVEKHDGYHHTDHFRQHYIILQKGNKGYREYGHVTFEGGRETAKEKL
ncbi:hypothetical protein BX600DRAFT_544134 [Xylariales sp. PMI_506]|nr:hypothetical protein BX600DRAFT_544134 [Xylariales sp. PMI_506]